MITIIHSKIFKLVLPALSQLHLDVLLHHLVGCRVVPLPLQVHRLSLLFGHQTDLVVFVVDHAPLFVFSSVHDCEDGVVCLPSFELGLCGVQIEGIFELDGHFPAVFG